MTKLSLKVTPEQGRNGRLAALYVEPLLVHAMRRRALPLSERRAFGLTRREREILALVAEGRTNGEVASALRISPLTVGKHLEHAYAKLGVINRTAAVHRAREHRIIR